MPISPSPIVIPSRLRIPNIKSPQIIPSASPFRRLYLPQIYPPQKPPANTEAAAKASENDMLPMRK